LDPLIKSQQRDIDLPQLFSRLRRKPLMSVQYVTDNFPTINAPLTADAYIGLSGDVVRTVEPHTESDPAALLLQFLAFLETLSVVGLISRVEGALHFTALDVVLVGATAKSRKGTSAGRSARSSRLPMVSGNQLASKPGYLRVRG
jgi:hypothetical protein